MATSKNPWERYQQILSGKQWPGSSGYWGDQAGSPFANRPNASGAYPGDATKAAIAAITGVQAPPGTARMPASPSYPIQVAPGVEPLFQTVNNVKSPEFQAQINSLLPQVNGTAFDPNVNPNVVRQNTKNPALQAVINNLAANPNAAVNPREFEKSAQFGAGINAGFQQFASDKVANRAQFDEFKNLFTAQTPEVTGNVNQENSAISRVFDGRLAGDLQTNANNRSAAVATNVRRSLDNLGRNNALLRMGGGDGSYANQQYLTSAQGVLADEARQKADLERNNLLYVLGQQGNFMGARNRGLDYLSNRQTIPIDLLTRMGANEDSRLFGLGAAAHSNNIYTTPAEQASQKTAMLSQLAQLDTLNNFYQLDSPQADLARRMGLLGNLQSANNANNFYGLRKEYEPDNSGHFTTSSISSGPANNGGRRLGNILSQYPTQSYNNPSIASRPAVTNPIARNPLFASGASSNPTDIGYYNTSGQWPGADPNYSSELYNYLRSNQEARGIV